MSRKEKAENLEARLRAEGREAIGGASNEKRISLPHSSIVAEIWNDVNPFFDLTLSPFFGILMVCLLGPGNGPFFAFDRVSAAWDTFCFRG
jgi:hypothetical protein